MYVVNRCFNVCISHATVRKDHIGIVIYAHEIVHLPAISEYKKGSNSLPGAEFMT